MVLVEVKISTGGRRNGGERNGALRSKGMKFANDSVVIAFEIVDGRCELELTEETYLTMTVQRF